MSARPLGAILAGGLSSRYGAPKARAVVGDVALAERVLRALRPLPVEPVLIANDPDAFPPLGIEVRSDLRPGLGPLGGIHTALHWAAEAGRPGALVVACDMPFVGSGLLAELLARADVGVAGAERAAVVVPESGGRRGAEPLCAYYDVACLAAIEARLARDDRRVVGFWEEVAVVRLPAAEVARHGDPERLFLNINTVADRERAEALWREAEAEHG
jgi:molybdopterin-guanine dinucleotide biosynthesis protein A